jgi:hypothetical protein
MSKQPSFKDAQRLRQALERATATPHALVPNWKEKENEQAMVQRRAGSGQFKSGSKPAANVKRLQPKPVGRRQNSDNNAAMKKAAKLIKTPLPKYAAGTNKRTGEAFGVKPLDVL